MADEGDPTERERAEHRLTVFAAASRAFTRAEREPGAILDVLTRIAAEALGDLAMATIVDPAGTAITRVVVHHEDPAIAQQLRDRYVPPLPLGGSFTERVLRSGKLERLAEGDLEAVVRVLGEAHEDLARRLIPRSIRMVPIRAAGGVIGALTATRLDRARPHDALDEQLLEGLADRASLALENARLLEQERATSAALVEALHRLERIQAVTAELSRARTPAEVAALTVRSGAEAVLADACILWQLHDDGSLVIVDAQPAGAFEAWRVLHRAPGLPAFTVADSGEPLWVSTEDDYRQAAPALYAQRERAGLLRAFAALPLRAGTDRRGVLVYSFPLGHVFDAEDKAYLSTLARQCEQALERAELFVQAELARTEAEQARARAEAASRAKDEFLAMLGHELRNPLAPIVTALDLLRLRGAAGSREMQSIERQVTHLTRLVDDLLDVSRITRGLVTLEKQPIDLATVVTRSLEIAGPLIEQRRHVVTVAVPRGLRLEGDATRLAQVISNLLTNAAKYTPAGGTISVSARRDGGELVLSVADTGMGIAPELLPSLFDLFVQGPRSPDRSQGGLGIGLALVRNIVVLHGGTVAARSDGPGRGAELVVRLPALAGQARPTPPPTAVVGYRSLRQRRVLVVDDNEDAAELLADLLRRSGHEVRVANDGPHALRVFESFSPEVAILDLGLPVMDGYELATRMRTAARELVLYALTGYGQEQDVSRSSAAGFARHFVKPVTAETILRSLDE